MPESEDAEKLNKLVEQKLPLVQADYESYFAVSSRIEERQNRLRTWEVAILAAILAFVARTGTIEFEIALPIIMVSGAFAFLDAFYGAEGQLIRQDVLDVESKLQETDPSRFRDNIVTWQFGNTLVMRRGSGELVKRTLGGAIVSSSPALAWHSYLSRPRFRMAYPMTKPPLASIHRIADKAGSRKLLFTISDAYALGQVLRADSSPEK